MTKVDVISGFLGAGKTTLIKKLLAEALKDEQVVLIENEFGEIGIDGGFLKDAGIQVTEMNSGCICCSLSGDFGDALLKVITEYHPDRIIIEPSGVGKLSDVMEAVRKVSKECELDLNAAVTVADAGKCKIYMKNFGEFYDNQVSAAGAIILSRTQNISEEKLNNAVALLREKNPEAAILTTPWDEISGDKILKAMEEGEDLTKKLMAEAMAHHHDDDDDECCGHHHDDDDDECCGHHHHHHHHHDDGHHEHHHDGECGCGHDHHHHHHHHDADEVFTSFGVETPKKFEKADLSNALEILSESTEYGTILRAKGMLPLTDNTWAYFDLVPGEYEIRSGEPDYTGRLCVIGSELKEDRLKELFRL